MEKVNEETTNELAKLPPLRTVAGVDRNKGIRVLEFDSDGYPVMPLHGTMTGGQTLRRIRVNYDGELYVVPNVIKQVSVTKAIEATGDDEAANAVLSESSTAGLATPWVFNAVVPEQGGAGYITKAIVTCQAEAQTARLTLYLFRRVPTSNLLDDTANTAPDLADIAHYQGKIDFPALETIGTTDSNTLATPSTVGNLPMAFICDDIDDALYGILVTRDVSATFTAGENVTVVLTVEQM